MQLDNVEDVYPLSPMQQGMLFHSLYTPSLDVYFQQLSCGFRGDFDVSAFRRAWERSVDRHSILRTAFFWDGLDEPLQVVRQQVSLPWHHIDWRELPADEQEDRLSAYLEADLSKGFDLREPPLMRLALIHLAENTHQFIWSFHHLVLDGWSKQLLLTEVFTFYEAFRRQLDWKLPQSRPYRDYIAWLEKQNLSRAEEFWKEKLRGLTSPTLIDVGAGASASTMAGQPRGYGEEIIGLGKTSTASLQGMAREHRLTLNTVAAGAWALLLNRYSGENDVVFGATVSGRPAELTGVDGMIGIFINTLPVRVEVKEKERISSWLRDLQQQLVEMRQYEFSPLIQIQRWSEVPRGKELFNCLFVFENYPAMQPFVDSGAKIDIGGVHFIERSNYPLTVELVLRAELNIKITCDKSQYEKEAIKRMAGHYKKLLQSIAENPDQRIAEIEMLTEEEKQQVLIEWNDTAAAYGRKRNIKELIEEQAEKTPDRVAVVYEQEQVSYQELNRRANHLAHYLRGKGVGPEVVVCICVPRSVEMVVALIGILKAGGAYLPLDPGYPAHRLAYMLDQAQVKVMITQESLRNILPEYEGEVICLQDEWPKIAMSRDENPALSLDSNNLAYVMYTSGSTGQPKGIGVSHRNVLRLVKQTNYARLTEEEVLLQFAPISFDASTFEIWGALLNGGRLVVYKAGNTSWEELGRGISEAGVTTLWLTAELFHQMIDSQLKELKGVAQLLAGGDVLSVRHVERAAAELRGCRVINGYGPTEGTTFSTTYEIGAGERLERSVPIGRPIANTQTYILDEEMRALPVGVAGEVCIGGAGLARAYMNRPELTAEKFVPEGLSGASGERLYRTGDVGRFLRHGEIEYLGRKDQQVKIRGYRIEPGEIEAVVRQHPAIEECVVLARQAAEGEKRLLGYVVCKSGQRVGERALRSFVSERLPEYMTPAAFFVLESFPLTANGKLDRKALPEVPQASSEGDDRYVGPRTLVEEVMAGIWAEVLHLERVAIDENFFELGGHSLLAMQVTSRLREAFKVELPVRTLFEKPTIAGLARSVEKAIAAAGGMEAPPIEATARDGELRLSFAQERLWFLDQLEPGSPAYNSRVASRLKGPVNLVALKNALTEIVRRHEILRTSFPAVNGRPAQVIMQPLRVSFPIADLSLLDALEREFAARKLIAREVRRALDLSKGPVARAYLLRLSQQEHILLLVIHHIAFDAWSANVLLREMAALYATFSQGQPSTLDELRIQYADYAHWQREWLRGEALRSLLSYWKQQLGGAPVLLNLRTDRPRPTESNSRGATIDFSLTEELTSSLGELSRQENSTLFMTLMAAFQTLLSRYSGQEDISVGTPIAGRDHVETEGLIGCFINTLVVRSYTPGDLKFRELLRKVRHVMLEAFANQELPFEKIVDALGIERNPSYTPLYQVLLGLVKTPVNRLHVVESTNLTIGSVPTHAGTANLDLVMELREIGGRLVGSVEYRTDLFNDETIMRMISHFEILLTSIVANPDTRLSLLEMLTESEKEQQSLKKNRRAEINRRRLAAVEPRAVKLD